MNSLVKTELEVFLKSHLPAQALDVVDDIVLDYLTSFLQSLAEDDSTCIDDFIDMMGAYIPGFDTLQSNAVYAWLIDLAAKLQSNEDNESNPEQNKLQDIQQEEIHPSKEECHATRGQTTTPNCVSHENRTENEEMPGHIPDKFSTAVESLCELFPMATQLEAHQCLMVANGDVNEAARVMLMKCESEELHGPTLDSNPKIHNPSNKRKSISTEDNKKLKNDLVSRYGFVDVKSDDKTYQPSLQNKDDKKLIRYRDNLVVSTKGERFSLIKKQENEDEKKTYVNLKPARKYRFH